MGTSGFVLKKKENADFEKLIFDVKTAAYQACLISHIESELYDSMDVGVYVHGNIANTFDEVPGAQQWLMYIYSDGYDDEYDWLISEGNVFRVIIFDRIRHCEEILLDFLYEYFRRNPEDYFWCGDEWYFTFDDIARIKQREFDPLWCYKDPRLNEEEK